jgi:pantothenate kinase type III
MLLAIDAGNTNIVFAACEGENVRGQWRAVTSTPKKRSTAVCQAMSFTIGDT